jgi:hypothetical protein
MSAFFEKTIRPWGSATRIASRFPIKGFISASFSAERCLVVPKLNRQKISRKRHMAALNNSFDFDDKPMEQILNGGFLLIFGLLIRCWVKESNGCPQ